MTERVIKKLCPDIIYQEKGIVLSSLKTWEDYCNHQYKESWELTKEDFNEYYHYFILYLGMESRTFVREDDTAVDQLSLLKVYPNPTCKGEYIIVYRNTMDVPKKSWDECYINDKIRDVITRYLNKEKETNTKSLDLDIQKEAYESSSELFSFKDMRRGVIEHGRVCYIEGYKKHSELFSTFLVKNGYFSDEELHKVLAEFDAYLNERPAISIRTCEDILKKLKIFDYSERFGKKLAYATELNSIQKDIVMHYCETLTNDKKILRIKKSRQNGISTILSIIAYLETQNSKRVLYIGCSDPRTMLGQKFNQFFTYKRSLTVKGLLGNRFDLIIVDDPNTDNLECLKTLVTCNGENGKMIVALTPRGPKKYGYNEIKTFFKKDSGDMFTYSTGPCRRSEELLELSPDDRNEIMGDFID